MPALHELIRTRWSPRAFADREVSPETVHTLLEAARWAASCYNEQPWRYIVTRRDRPEPYRRLIDVLVPANALWAARAPVLMLGVAKREFSHNGTPNRHAAHDLGQASAQLALQAVALGLAIHQMGGFDAERARTAFAIPAAFEPVTAIAVGYPGSPDDLPAELKARETAPRLRKPLAALVFDGIWDAPAFD